MLSRNKASLLGKAAVAHPGDLLSPEEAIRDPFVLEFLDMRDEYSESDLEAALIEHLADFLLELGDDFAFIGRSGVYGSMTPGFESISCFFIGACDACSLLI